MEQFLTPKLEQNLSEISLEYVYKKELIFPDCPGFVKRNIISKSPAGHEDILASWMTKGYIPNDYEAWQHVMRREPLPANMRFSELGDLIVHISKKEASPFNIVYCPEKMQDFQKWRVRIWWEYFRRANKFCEISYKSQEKSICYSSENIEEFLEQEQILNDTYMRTLAKKFYKEEYK